MSDYSIIFSGRNPEDDSILPFSCPPHRQPHLRFSRRRHRNRLSVIELTHVWRKRKQSRFCGRSQKDRFARRLPSCFCRVFNRAGSLRSKPASKQNSPSSHSLPGVQKSKTEPPLHFSMLPTDKESPRNTKDYNYFEQFPAGPSTDTTYVRVLQRL